MEKKCYNCKYWKGVNIGGDLYPGKCEAIVLKLQTAFDCSCPRFESNIQEELIKWKPLWYPIDILPSVFEKVLMFYQAQPDCLETFRIGYHNNGVWYKRAGSKTNKPDWWTYLPRKDKP